MASIKRLSSYYRRSYQRWDLQGERRGQEAQITQVASIAHVLVGHALHGRLWCLLLVYACTSGIVVGQAPIQYNFIASQNETPRVGPVSGTESGNLSIVPEQVVPLNTTQSRDANGRLVPGPSSREPTPSVLLPVVPGPTQQNPQDRLDLNSPEPYGVRPESAAKLDPASQALAQSDANWGTHMNKLESYIPSSDAKLPGESLLLADVIASVYRAFPEVEQARLLGRVTSGQQLAALGEYDVKLDAYSVNQPIGFYQTYRQGITVARNLWYGGYLSTGYRIGRGTYEPWYRERETNDAGEFKVTLVQPLLQGKAIDARRVELFQSNLRRQAVGPEIQESILYASFDAANAYWNWVAAGIILRAQIALLELAEVRERQLLKLLEAGQGKQIDIIVNDQLIAERRLKVVESEQKFWQSASKLSLYLRDEAGMPMVPSPDWLPKSIIQLGDLPQSSLQEDFVAAIQRRPELQLIDLQIQGVRWDVQLANNQLLPELDFIIQNSKDLGDPASSSRDKTPFELESGLQGRVPVQRRKARGKLQEYTAKIEQLQQKRRLQQDKISIELQNAQAGLFASVETIRQAAAALDASRAALRRYRIAFEAGQLDLIFLNLVEPKVTENEVKLLEQQQRLLVALAAKQAALGLDPFEQALLFQPPPLPEENPK